MTHANQCELCASSSNLSDYYLENKDLVTVCETCSRALVKEDFSNVDHWQSLQDAIWSEKSAVKILSYRILHNLRKNAWASDLLEQIYLEDSELKVAKSHLFEDNSSGSESKATTDSNGTPLLEGDSVTLIKDLDVKGAGFTAKRGTLVKNIRLTENPEHIEGRVNGIQIVLVAKFLKKVVE